MKYEYGNQFCVLAIPRPNSCFHISGKFSFMISSMHCDASCFVMWLMLQCSDIQQFVAKRASLALSSARVSSCRPAQPPYFRLCPYRAHTWSTLWPIFVPSQLFPRTESTVSVFFIRQATPDDSELARGRPHGFHCSVESFFRVLADGDVPTLVHQLHPTFQDQRVSCCDLVERKTPGNLLSIHCPVKLLFLRSPETDLPS